MKQHEVDILSMIAAIPLALYYSSILEERFPDLPFATYVFAIIFFGLLTFILAIIAFFNFGNIAKSLLFFIKGHSLLPLVFFPFYINRSSKNGKVIIKFTFNWTTIFRDLFSYDFMMSVDFTDSQKVKQNNTICILGLQCRGLVRIVIPLIICLYFYISEKITLAFFFLLLSLLFLSVAFLETKFYHGDFIKCSNIKKGDLILYVSKEMVIYSTSRSSQYFEFMNWLYTLNQTQIDYYRNFIVTVIKHIVIVNEGLKDKIITADFLRFINDTFLPYDLIRMGLYDEEWELFKTVLLCAIVSDDRHELSFLSKELRLLKLKLGSVLDKFNTFFDWYISLSDSSEVVQQEKYPLVSSKDRFCSIAFDYKSLIEKIERKVLHRQ